MRETVRIHQEIEVTNMRLFKRFVRMLAEKARGWPDTLLYPPSPDAMTDGSLRPIRSGSRTSGFNNDGVKFSMQMRHEDHATPWVERLPQLRGWMREHAEMSEATFRLIVNPPMAPGFYAALAWKRMEAEKRIADLRAFAETLAKCA